MKDAFRIFLIFLRLGSTSFGGPIAHLGYFRREFVEKRGPNLASGWIHGLKVLAVAVVAQAIWAMGRALCPDATRASFALVAALLATLLPASFGQILAILLAGIFGSIFLRGSSQAAAALPIIDLSKKAGAASLLLFLTLLILLPVLARTYPFSLLQQVDVFYRAGSLVFGGGHVLLPLLQAEVVPKAWVSNDQFLAGYGMAQAVPGPLFTFAGYLGAVANGHEAGLLGGLVCLLAIFLPAFLLILGFLPFWQRLRHFPSMQHAMMGINASVVGILLAAFYNSIWASAVQSNRDFLLAISCFLLLVIWKRPPWAVAIFAVGAAYALGI